MRIYFYKISLLSLFCFLVLIMSSSAQTITLHNGRTINGQIIEDLDSHLVIQRNDLRIVVPKKQVRDVLSEDGIWPETFTRNHSDPGHYWTKLIYIKRELDEYLPAHEMMLSSAYESEDNQFIMRVLLEGVLHVEYLKSKIESVPGHAFFSSFQKMMAGYCESIIRARNSTLDNMVSREKKASASLSEQGVDMLRWIDVAEEENAQLQQDVQKIFYEAKSLYEDVNNFFKDIN